MVVCRAGQLEEYMDYREVTTMLLPGVGSVETDIMPILGIIAEIFHMTQEMPFCILGDDVAQMGAHAHVSNRRLLNAPFLDG